MREADFIEHFSSPLPAAVFGEWLGLTREQTSVLWTTARAYVKAWESFDKSSVAIAAHRLSFFKDLLSSRMGNPRYDRALDRAAKLVQGQVQRSNTVGQVRIGLRPVLFLPHVAP
jgi:cytochrome P450